MSYKGQLKEIQEAIKAPNLVNNIRGQLKAACLLLDDMSKKNLSIDYAEHIAWIIEENRIGIKSSVLNTLKLRRLYLAGQATIHEVRVARIEAFYPPQFRESLGKAQSMALLAAAHAIYNGFLYETSYAASYAAALYHAGDDWDAQDKSKHRVAHQIGWTESRKESQWQLARIFEYLEKASD